MVTANTHTGRADTPAARLPRSEGALLRWGAPLLVVAFTLAIFARTLGFGLYWDDYHHARPWALGEVLGTFVGPFDPLGIEPVYYRPLTVATFALDWALWGYGAFGYHLTNVLLHAAAAALLFAVLRRVTDDALAALAGALFFAAIPSNAATAIYISERSDALATIFTLGGALCAYAYRRSRATGWLAALGVMTVLAFMSKEIGVALTPLVALLWAYWALPAPQTDESGGLLAAPGRWMAAWLRAARALLTRDQIGALLTVALPPALLVIGYLGFRSVVLPTGVLGERYSETASPLRGLASAVFWTFKAVPWEVSGLALPLLGLGAALAMALRPHAAAWRVVALGFGWVVIACLPLSYLGQVEPRLLYLPAVGHAIVVCGLASVLGGALRDARHAGPAWRRGLAALALGVALAWAGATAVSLARAQDEFGPGSPKMLGGMLEIYTNERVRDLYDPYHLVRIEQELRAAGMIP